MKKIKLLFALLAVVLVSLLTSCLPIGVTNPDGTFNVGISVVMQQPLGFGNTCKSAYKNMIIDGDTISISLEVCSPQADNPIYVDNINIQLPKHLTMSYWADTDPSTGSICSQKPLLLPSGIEISTLSTTGFAGWVDFGENTNTGYFVHCSSLHEDETGSPSPAVIFNADRYIVLRKLKPSGYLYYWIKVRFDDANNTFRTGTKLSILNGKIKMNNLVTGQ